MKPVDDLVDEEVGEAPASIFREPLHQEPPIKVVSGKHSMFTHFPKDRNCEVRKSTKGSCRKRTGDQIPPAENIGDLITADHKVPKDDCESRGARIGYPMVPIVSV